ncbi:MAG: DEAD/DEAH box helicase [Prevotella sp.]
MKVDITSYQAKYLANTLTRRLPANDTAKLTATLQDARVDLTPHQIEAALFAFKSPLSKGAILADEVGLGKTIEAGIILSQHWAEHHRHLLVICPANLRMQWCEELQDKFFLSAILLESKSFNSIVEEGHFNPFDQDKIVICSYQFAKAKAAYLKRTDWDLVVIDEAHRLRNVYKPTNKISNIIKDALESRKKILMTATPLQNSILEMYGLVSIIDSYVFGDLKSFKEQFNKTLDESAYMVLRNRLKPVCKRTLRRQVLEYIRYTKRIAILEEFFPSKDEQALYELVSDYLQRPILYALPNSQRQLMTLILRKLLASSTYAIYGTFCTLIDRLQQKLDNQEHLIDPADLTLDFESIAEEQDEWFSEEDYNDEELDEEAPLHPNDIEGIKKEINELCAFRDLALKIKKNSKAEHLFQALKKGFQQLEQLGANQKALIFTESRRTQEFLYTLLEERGYKGKVVLFNGTNTDKQSTKIYKDWRKRYSGSDKLTGSPTADRRQAIVDYFRESATIMIATEAAAEGINLQFCSLIVNYDMPWNPQRIEQRIGRCHRYGQQFDVVVINFLNKANEADIRVYEILDKKFQLFNGIFGTSDEVLGSIGNGVDFEKRIAEIYNSCRTKEEIRDAFDELQSELQSTISDNMLNARSTLLENFDTEVAEKLRVDLANSLSSLDTFEKQLWMFLKFCLDGKATFDDENRILKIHAGNNFSGSYYLASSKNGKKQAAGNDESRMLRIGHPMVQHILAECKSFVLPCHEVKFNYTNTPEKVVYIEQNLLEKSGWMHVEKLSIDSFEQEDHLLISCFTDDNEHVPVDIAQRILTLYAVEDKSVIKIPASVIHEYTESINSQRSAIIEESSTRNQNFFDEEMDKLDAWADDMKLSLDREIRDLDAEIKLRKGEAKKSNKLAEKVAIQRVVKELENKRKEKRQNLYDAQDEVDNRKEKIISKVERMLDQKVEQTVLFNFKWKII